MSVLKTYTIKPMEWEQPTEFAAYSGNYEIVLWDRRNEESCVKLRRSNVFEEPLSFETIEAAKAKAQELHEAELMKHLQECHSLSHGDANLSVSTPLEAGSAQNGVNELQIALHE